MADTTFRVRTSTVAVLAFDRWLAQLKTEKKDPSIKHGEAFEELLRRAGMLPPEGKVY